MGFEGCIDQWKLSGFSGYQFFVNIFCLYELHAQLPIFILSVLYYF